jgi:hypothetical protein
VGAGKSILGSGSDLVFVDESAEAFSAVHVRWVARWSRHGAWRDRWALIERPVRAMVVVVLNVRLQNAFEVASVDDQEPVEALAAKDSDETLGDRVRFRCPRRRADDPDLLALKDLVEGSCELRVAVADQEADRRVALVSEAPTMLRACCVVQAPVGCAVTPATYALRVASSMKTSTYRRRIRTVSTVRKSHEMMADLCARRNERQLSEARRGAGSIPARLRIAHTVLAASWISRRASSPWILL